MNGRKYSDEIIRLIFSLRNRGLTQEQISKETSVPRSTVSTILNGYAFKKLDDSKQYVNENGLDEQTDFYTNFTEEWEKARTEVLLNGFSNQWNTVCRQIRACASR